MVFGRGRPRGGPSCFTSALLALTVACAGTSGPRAVTPGDPAEATTPADIYRDAGLHAGPARFPAVIDFSSLAGPADSVMLLLAMSLPASALRFERAATGFAAEYAVTLDAHMLETEWRTEKRWSEVVRVGSFAETTRTDESIVFLQHLIAPHGQRLVVQVRVADANSSRALAVADTLTLARYDSALALGDPLVVYQGTGRTTRFAQPAVVPNPRSTIAYAADAARLYVEVYNADQPPTARVTVRDDAGSAVWANTIEIAAGTPLMRQTMIELPVDSLPLGRLSIEVTTDGATSRTVPLFVTISEEWMVANFEEVLQFLRFIATPQELDSIAHAGVVDRRTLWDSFWRKRDPIPATPMNEFRDEFFQRMRAATLQFAESDGRPGWQTDRGEVFVVLGAPDRIDERFAGRSRLEGQPNALEWMYHDTPGGSLTLLFIDNTGFGRFELDASSRAAFRNIADRMRPR